MRTITTPVLKRRWTGAYEDDDLTFYVCADFLNKYWVMKNPKLIQLELMTEGGQHRFRHVNIDGFIDHLIVDEQLNVTVAEEENVSFIEYVAVDGFFSVDMYVIE